jgi:SWI/SNF-related matrix-associated actin-dependent regulator 1 of chromatin subfamily A
MRDVELYNDGRVVFQKVMWHDSEIVLAKCYNFPIDIETGEITANVGVTFKKAIYHFIKLAFRNFSENLNEQSRRDDFYGRLEAMYANKDNSVLAVMQNNLPYFDKLYSHQKDTLVESYYHKYFFGALDMGLGKTLISASLSRIGQISRTVIVCPAAVKWNWYRDLTAWGFNELFFTIHDRSKRRSMKALNERFVIVNYDIIGSMEKELVSSDIGHFIFDESHYLKNHNSGRFKAVNKIVSQFPNARITFLSGTPVSNRVNDIFAYLKLVGHELGLVQKKFLDEYTVSTRGRGGERVTGGKNLQDLNMKLANFMIRKTKEECLDLPGKIFLSYRFELDDYRDEYDKVIAELAQNKEMKSLTGNLHSLNIITSKAKLPGIKELAETIIEGGKKVVIFGSYRDPLNNLEEYFGDRCVKIDGSVDSWTRDQHIQRFHNDPECLVFLGNMRAAGVGINLTNASNVIFINFPFTPAELYQATDRCDRIGQKYAVNVHYTFCDESIDEYIYEIIVDKEKDINALIDQGKEAVLRENTTEILIKKLLNRNDVVIENVDDSLLEQIPGEDTENEENSNDTVSDEKAEGGDTVQQGEDSRWTTPVGQPPLPKVRPAAAMHPEYPAKGYDSTVGFPKLNPQTIGRTDREIPEMEKPNDEQKHMSLPAGSSVSESFEHMQELVRHVEDNKSQFIFHTPIEEKPQFKEAYLDMTGVTPIDLSKFKATGNISQETIDANWAHVEKTRNEIANKTFPPGHQVTLEEGIKEAIQNCELPEQGSNPLDLLFQPPTFD